MHCEIGPSPRSQARHGVEEILPFTAPSGSQIFFSFVAVNHGVNLKFVGGTIV